MAREREGHIHISMILCAPTQDAHPSRLVVGCRYGMARQYQPVDPLSDVLRAVRLDGAFFGNDRGSRIGHGQWEVSTEAQVTRGSGT